MPRWRPYFAIEQRSLFWTVVGVLLGLLLTVVFYQWIAAWLPGPKPDFILSGLRPARGEGQFVGCTAYNLWLITAEPLDFAYIRVGFPQNIKGAWVGHPVSKIAGQSNTLEAQAFGAGRNLGGECDALQTGVGTSTIGVSFNTSANVLTIHISRLEPHESVMGIVVVANSDSAMVSEQPISEGHYEYTKWGTIIRRKLDCQYLRVKEAESQPATH